MNSMEQESPAEKISSNMALMVNKMNRETIEEYRNLAKAILETVESVKKSADLAVAEINTHIDWLQSKDQALSDQLKRHVDFVNDTLQAKGLIMETFNSMQARYQEPSK